VSMKVADAAQQVLHRSLPKLLSGEVKGRALDLSLGSYFGRRRPEDGRIDWSLPAQQVYNLHRAVAPPYPGAFTEVNDVVYIIEKARLSLRPAGSLPPGLAVVDNCIFGVCGDGHMLAISALTAGDAAISAAQLQSRLAAPVSAH